MILVPSLDRGFHGTKADLEVARLLAIVPERAVETEVRMVIHGTALANGTGRETHFPS
jgi:hypothetical protein